MNFVIFLVIEAISNLVNHFLKLNGLIKTNIASNFPHPKIEKTIPHFLTIEEYNRFLVFFYHRIQALVRHLATPGSQELPSRYTVVYGVLSQARTAVSNIAVTIIHTNTVIPFKSFHVIQHHAGGLHIFMPG
jgi:hypothetical protein